MRGETLFVLRLTASGRRRGVGRRGEEGRGLRNVFRKQVGVNEARRLRFAFTSPRPKQRPRRRVLRSVPKRDGPGGFVCEERRAGRGVKPRLKIVHCLLSTSAIKPLCGSQRSLAKKAKGRHLFPGHRKTRSRSEAPGGSEFARLLNNRRSQATVNIH